MTRLFLRLLILCVLLLPSLARATVWWADDFENHLYPNWVGSCATPLSPTNLDNINVCYPQISTNKANSPTHSLYTLFPGNHVQAGGFMDRNATPGTRNIYMRFYYYTVNFIYDATATKHFYNISSATGNDGLELVWLNLWGSREFAANTVTAQPVLCPTNGVMDVSCNLYPNVGHVSLNDGQWYCIETHVNAGSPNTANGIVEVWVNGVQTMSYQNLLLSFGPNGKYDIVRHYAQWGQGSRYIDDLVVGDARIGCAGSPPPTDTTPPPTPTNLTVTP